MKAILTKYLGPTNTKPSRMKAIEPDGNYIVINWNHELSQYENHERAAKELMKKMNWDNDIIGGVLKNNYVFVMIRKKK